MGHKRQSWPYAPEGDRNSQSPSLEDYFSCLHYCLCSSCQAKGMLICSGAERVYSLAWWRAPSVSSYLSPSLPRVSLSQAWPTAAPLQPWPVSAPQGQLCSPKLQLTPERKEGGKHESEVGSCAEVKGTYLLWQKQSLAPPLKERLQVVSYLRLEKLGWGALLG